MPSDSARSSGSSIEIVGDPHAAAPVTGERGKAATSYL
jgi:hypothetical protein